VTTILLVVSFVFAPVAHAVSDDDYFGPLRLIPVQHKLTNIANTPSGAFVHEIPIVIPPGRNDLEPSLSLSYNSQNRDAASIYGYGWDVSIPYIQRSNKVGSEKLYTDHYFISTMSGELEDISLSDGEHGSYGAKVEDGSFLKYDYATSTGAWTVTDKSGTVYTFGTGTSTQMYDTASTTRVFKWLLEDVRDQNNNYISYEYFHDDGQVYISKITYTGNDTTDGIFGVEFDREARSDDDQSYTTGFEVRTNYRISEIRVEVNDSWVRKYALAYTTGDNTKRSLLSSVTETGRDEDLNSIALPAHSFTYGAHSDSWTKDASWTIPENFDQNGVVAVDVNGDALPDIINSNKSGATHTYKVHINNGVDGWDDETGSWALPTHLAQGNPRHDVMALDLNGDGRVDILQAPYSGNGTVYINNGGGWDTASSTWSIPFKLVHSTGAPDHAIRVTDVNADGLPDVIFSRAANRKVYINEGEGSGWVEDTSWSVPTSFSSGGVEYRIRVFDANGDGLTDIVSSTSEAASSTSQVYLNNGTDGWEQDSNWSVPLAFKNNGYPQKGTQIFDVNRDGLVDLVKSITDEDVYLNNGDGTGWTKDDNYDVPVNFQDEDHWKLFDANGDGYTDIIKKNVSVSSADMNDAGDVDMLVSISTSDGAVIVPTYAATTDYVDGSDNLLNTLPFTFDTVSAIATNDGLTSTSTETYSYEGGEFYFATSTMRDRKFTGFHKIITTDPDNNVTKEYFHQGNTTDSTNGENSDDLSKIGLKYRSEIYDDSSNKYTQTVEKWENYDLSNDRDFVKRTRLTQYDYDGDASHKDKATEWTYDNTYGNITQEVQYGEVTASSQDGSFIDTGSDKFTTDYTYAVNTSDYIVGLKKQETLKDQSNNTVADAKWYYDLQVHGTVNTGNLTKNEQWATSTTWIDEEWRYDGTYGLVSTSTDALGNSTVYDYDSGNLYVATSTNPLNQATTYTYDYSSGSVKVTTDPNTRQFETTYDALDRPVLVKVPDLDTPATLVTKTQYTYTNSGVPRKTQVTQHLDGSTSFDIYMYADGLGRIIQERTEAEDSNVFSVVDTVYGDNGMVQKISLPYFDTGSANSTATTNNYLYTNYTYDALDRIVTAADVLGTDTYTYDDWETVVTDKLGNAKDTHVDAYDQLVTVEEHNGGSTYTTNYEYNGLGNLTKITDAANNLRNFTHNGLGHRLTAEDLHGSADATFGSSTYTYDDTGNLTQEVDAKSQTTNYTYDALSRVLTEDYTGDAGTEVTYTYDSGTNGVGHLTETVHGAGTTTLAYNVVGDIATETISASSTNYVTEYDYDRQGNITLLTYPDDAEVQHTYNTAGQLEKVEHKESGGSFSDVITDLDYGPHQQVVFKDFGNNVVSYYTYDPEAMYRLSNITTIDPEDVEQIAVDQVVEELSVVEEAIENQDVVEELAEEVVDETVIESTESVRPEREDGEVVIGEVFETENEEVVATTTEEATNEEATEATIVETPEKNTSITTSEETTEVAEDPENVEDVESETSTILGVIQNVFEELVGDEDPVIATTTDQVIATSSIAKLIKGKPSKDRATIKGKEIANQVKPQKRTKRGEYEIELVDINRIEGGVEVFARAWTLNKSIEVMRYDSENESWIVSHTIPKKTQVGFGDDGTVDIERFLIYNPPILVDDPSGDIIREEIDGETGKTKKRVLKEDPKEALLQELEHTISAKQKKYGSENIIRGKIGNTTSTFRPDADPESNSVDGYVTYEASSSWDTVHDATSGNYVNDSDIDGGPAFESTWQQSGSQRKIARGVFIFDTSALGDTEVISSAVLSVFGTHVNNADADGYDYGTVVQATIASSTNLSNDDYNDIGDSVDNPTEGSTRENLSSMVGNDYNDFTLNSTGIGWISKTGISSFGMREGHDVEDHPIESGGSNKINRLYIRWADYSGTTSDPKLVVEHSFPPAVPTSLETEGQTNPTGVSDLTPEFSAIYNDTDAGDSGTDYQIQVSTSTDFTTPYWDSTKTVLASSIIEGNRSELIPYNGSALTASTAYYWRIKFWDDNNTEGLWSTATSSFTMASALGSASGLYTNCVSAQSGDTNPIDLKCGAPVFSAIFSNSAGNDTGVKYRIQVATSSDFNTGMMWDSPSTGTPLSTVNDGARSVDIIYDGDPLSFDETIYYWRAKFWNSADDEGTWSSATSSFSTYDSEIFQDVHYSYDAVGNIIGIVNSADTTTATTTAYVYDDLYRLTEVRMGDELPSDWLDESWGYRFKSTSNSAQVDNANSNLAFDLVNAPAAFWDNVKSNGGDIRVTKADGVTEVAVDISNFSSGSETGTVFFDSTGLSTSADTDWYIYYGNSGASLPVATSTYGSEAVWGDYVGVWHLDEASGTRYDSSGNDNDVTENGGTSNSISSVVGNGVDIGGGKTLSITDGAQTGLDLSTNFSATVITKVDSITGHHNIFGKSTPSGNQRSYGARQSDDSGNMKMMLYVYPTGSGATSAFSNSLAYATSTAYHFGFVKDNTTAKFYRDGTSEGTDTTAGIYNSSTPFVIGAERTDGSDGFDGTIDELRIRTDVVSADWVATENNNLMDNSSFWTVGSQETSSAGSVIRTYTYDSIGNFTNKSDIGNYSYSGTGKANPHAATSVGGTTYTYDDNGNLTGDGTRTYTWNYDNSLASAVKSGTTYSHRYDHNRQRVTSDDGTTTTTYANKYYNTDGTSATKYVYANNELVATISPSDGGGGGSADTGFKTAGTIEVNTGWSSFTTGTINTSDDSRASCSSICDNSDDAQMSDFTFGISSGATIDGIEVAIEANESSSFGDIDLDVALSWNDGSSFTSTKTATVDGTSDSTYTLGGATDTWGRTWSDSELADGTFRVQFDKQSSTDSLNIDHVQVKVYYTTSGGGTSDTWYIHPDHLGSTAVLTNASSTEAQAIDYYPFGETRVNDDTDSVGISKQFIGEYKDDSDLSYLNARYYYGVDGRFISQDPVFLNLGVDERTQQALMNPQLLNSYSYSGNNPLNYTDPEGEFIQKVLARVASRGLIGGGLGLVAQGIGDVRTSIDRGERYKSPNSEYFKSAGKFAVAGATQARFGTDAGVTALFSLEFLDSLANNGLNVSNAFSSAMIDTVLGILSERTVRATQAAPLNNIPSGGNEFLQGVSEIGTQFNIENIDSIQSKMQSADEEN